MPPLRSDRASRACEACRRLKTRCYPSKDGTAGCLRCQTQKRDCSLNNNSRNNNIHSSNRGLQEISESPAVTSPARVEERLSNLENVISLLASQVESLTRQSSVFSTSGETSPIRTDSAPPSGEQDAPVLLIKGIAENVRPGPRDGSSLRDNDSDPISNRVLELQDAYELLSLFRFHYGRWVNFDEDLPTEQLLARVRASSLLFYSVCLVAARHTTQRHTNELAPIFFREAKRLLQESLLTTPQSLEFFQAAIILSLWSTTIGQVPLSIDSWLLTSYALQQGLASSMATSIKGMSMDSQRLRICCTWNHLCLAHLQYCVGTGRKSLLQEAQINRCADVLEFDVSQFEVRMVAELRLYWIIVSRCCASFINLSATRKILHTWRKEWAFLFDQPRSQFLDMGYSFAMLLAYCRSLHTKASKLSRSKLNEMVQCARNIISLAMEHTDERTPHLTDHIYHLITFSAIILCQLSSKYPNILAEDSSAASLRQIILDLVDWLRSIGLASHVSRVLANIIAAHYAKCMARDNVETLVAATGDPTINVTMPSSSTGELTSTDAHHVTQDAAGLEYSFQDLPWMTFFDFNADTMLWPQNNELMGNNYTPSNESWVASGQTISP